MSSEAIAKYFDHTILKPSATKKDVKKICDEAIQYNFFSVCINPVFVKYVKNALADSSVMTCSVIGFPLGTNTTELKAAETHRAITDGADEIDMVINVGALLDEDYEFVKSDIKAVVDAAKGKTVKVILETCLLSDDQIVKACELSMDAGAHFVKTSTGFAGGGATPEDVALMKHTVGNKLEVKASGGIKTLEDTETLIKAGADRIGASAGVSIMKELA